MAINITSRIRNAMVGLTVLLCAVFTVLIFLFVFVIEDRVFVNQVKHAQAQFSEIVANGDRRQLQSWQPSNATMKRLRSAQDLPPGIPAKVRKRIVEQAGVHEYFNDDHALFIARLTHPQASAEELGFLVYDVSDLLAVRGSKLSLFILIAITSLLVALVAVIVAQRLTRSTLAPIVKLSTALKENDLDEVVIEMANEFSEDEISVLTQELAVSLEGLRELARREFEFNRGVSHELRSPIQVAQSAVELLQVLDTDRTAQMAKPLARLHRSVAEMNEIADAFLWLSSARTVAEKDRCTLSQLRASIATLQASMTQPLSCTDSFSDMEHRYPVPNNALVVMLRNLVRNAAQHGTDDAIVINLASDEISVRNSLDGESTQSPGFGVGLSIVDALCSRFDCQINTFAGDKEYKVAIRMPSSSSNTSVDG